MTAASQVLQQINAERDAILYREVVKLARELHSLRMLRAIKTKSKTCKGEL